MASFYNNAGDIRVYADLAGFHTPEYGAPIRAGQTAGFFPGQGMVPTLPAVDGLGSSRSGGRVLVSAP